MEHASSDETPNTTKNLCSSSANCNGITSPLVSIHHLACYTWDAKCAAKQYLPTDRPILCSMAKYRGSSCFGSQYIPTFYGICFIRSHLSWSWSVCFEIYRSKKRSRSSKHRYNRSSTVCFCWYNFFRCLNNR